MLQISIFKVQNAIMPVATGPRKVAMGNLQVSKCIAQATTVNRQIAKVIIRVKIVITQVVSVIRQVTNVIMHVGNVIMQYINICLNTSPYELCPSALFVDLALTSTPPPLLPHFFLNINKKSFLSLTLGFCVPSIA